MNYIILILKRIAEFEENTNYTISHVELTNDAMLELEREMESIRGSRYHFELKTFDFWLDNGFIKEENTNMNEITVIAQANYI